ncbi:MAG: flagellar protein FlbA [Robiginitomaculum sp.]|nr:MAG: flagellar protein FlbA [Robiginitomaculum sp.]
MTFAIQSMLDQGPDQQKRTLRGAVGGARLPDIDQSNGNKAYKKIVPILRRSKKLIDAHDYPGAAKLAMRALDMDEDCALSNHIMGICLDKLGHLSKALELYERAWRLDPSDGEIYQNLALVAWKLDMLPAAEKFLQLFLEMQPGDVNGVINLGGVLRDLGRFDEAVELIRAAIYGHQDQSMLWNALATVLLESGQPEQGLTFYDEALRLEPNNARIWHNMAYAAGLAGDRTRAAKAGEKALGLTTAPEDRSTIEYGLSQAYLALGQLEKGWHAHMARFDPNGIANMLTVIDAPRWDGEEDLTGKRVLLMGEQGLGDEVLYMNAAQEFIDAVGPKGRVDFAVERRLMPVVERTFAPKTLVRHMTVNQEGRQIRIIPDIKDWSVYDYYVPMGNAVAAHRKDLSDFPDHKGYLIPDPKKVKAMQEAVAALPTGPKIGLCWKSMVMNANRAKYFSPFDAWKSVLKTPGAVFVSMQYGDCTEEIAQAQKELGVTIHELPGLDLKADLDGVAAAGLALDITIGPMNASTNLSAAHGGMVWFLASPDHWPLHSTGTIPWYPTSRVFSPKQFGVWEETMARVADALAEAVSTKKAA